MKDNINVKNSNFANKGGKVSKSKIIGGNNIITNNKPFLFGWASGIITSILGNYLWEYFIKGLFEK